MTKPKLHLVCNAHLDPAWQWDWQSGEGGAYNRTPHDVFLAWFRDLLDILRESSIGFSLWNFRGAFGVLDSGRADVAYEDFQGHKLDRKLLDLLKTR